MLNAVHTVCLLHFSLYRSYNRKAPECDNYSVQLMWPSLDGDVCLMWSELCKCGAPGFISVCDLACICVDRNGKEELAMFHKCWWWTRPKLLNHNSRYHREWPWPHFCDENKLQCISYRVYTTALEHFLWKVILVI